MSEDAINEIMDIDFDEFSKKNIIDPTKRLMDDDTIDEFLTKFKINNEYQDETLLALKEELKYYFDECIGKVCLEDSENSEEKKRKNNEELEKELTGARNYFLNTRFKEEIADYVTEMQSQAKMRQAMRRIEKSVEALYELLIKGVLDNFMILRHCKCIDNDMQLLRNEPGLFDDTDEFNVFPMILSS